MKELEEVSIRLIDKVPISVAKDGIFYDYRSAKICADKEREYRTPSLCLLRIYTDHDIYNNSNRVVWNH